jgi:hypothetical protein
MTRGRKIAIAATVGALAITGTAVAAGGGPSGGPFGDDHKQELAGDLAAQLDGVNPNEVEQALDAVQEQRMDERRAQMAAGIAAQLNGVSADEVAEALAKHEDEVRSEQGERPGKDSLVATLSEELDKSQEEIAAALESAREASIEEHQAEALERLDEAVESGDLTEEQADQIRKRIESGPPAGGLGHGGPGGPGGPLGPGGPPPAGDGSSDDASSGTFEVAPPATA